MAGYREHISVSGMLGVLYGAGAVFGFGFTPVQGALAGCLTWVAGMLPDLDSQSGRPVRELFSLIAAVTPLVLTERLLKWGGSTEGAMLLAIALYAAVRFGGAALLGKLAVHRGMFHSIPAMLIAMELTFLGYESPSVMVKLLMAVGVGLGFLSHLVLDEMYSVEWTGVRLRLNQAAGSALKLIGKSFFGNVMAYGLLGLLSYVALVDIGWLERPRDIRPPHLRQAMEPGLPQRS